MVEGLGFRIQGLGLDLRLGLRVKGCRGFLIFRV